MGQPIISVSGLRGIVGESLSPEVVVRYVGAYAASLPAGPVAVARDGRTTGPMIAELVRGTLAAAGREVIDAGIAATPTLGVLVRHIKCAGGIQISASHNPPQYNGLKLFSAAGRVLPAVEGEQVLARYRTGEATWVGSAAVGTTKLCDDPHAEHLRLVLATVNVPRIRQRKFKVLLDANHGAGSILGQRLLESLGCQVTLLGSSPDGKYAHPAEPTAENLNSVLTQVSTSKAEIGFCQDPDADRLAIIDEQGRYIGEEYTLALCLDHVLRSPASGSFSKTVAINCASSLTSSDTAARHGVKTIRTKVGEANVVDAMLAHQTVFGGEGNGGPIDPRVGWVRDSFVGMSLVLDAMAARNLPVSKLADELPRYEIRKHKVDLPPEKLPVALNALAKHFAGQEQSREDGLRIAWLDKWLLVRGSNTEPIVRIIAEGADAAAADALCSQAAAVIGE